MQFFNIFRLVRVTVAPVVAASLFLTSCVSTAIDPSTMTPSEIALRQQENEDIRIVQGVATGALIGAAGGALLAAIAGGDGRAIARGAIVGGVVGGVAGGVDAHNVNQGARAEANQQAKYRETIASANRAIAYYRRSNSIASQLVASENSRIARLNSEYRSGRIDRAAYRRQMSGASGNVAIVDSQISRTDRDIAALRSARSDGAPVNSQISALQAEKARLEQQRNALRVAYSRVTRDVDLGV